MQITDVRRFFRNRFEYYMDKNDASGAGVRDEVELSLKDVCELLEWDRETFPRRYDPDMRKLCGHEYLTWFREERTYADVARLLSRKLADEDGRMPRVGGRWVYAVLKAARQSSAQIS
ncbi:hypothetical protein FY136_20655 [Agrobacterium tumefaciens]|uniref:hypothetical protein n=1 Tax=Agrobacterium tumefaciens TaxID=358 RepID=UPI0021CE6D15|nr:hypothetical protein [Agrobacterium tumefaciens]UXT51657.1 hypothetical protein FY136_20655 [Agrobacterium tumefaciens]